MSNSSSESTLMKKEVQPTSVKFLENGLVDVATTPEHLKPIVDKNTSESPLLRLPGEVRNMIWDHVFSGMDVNIHDIRDGRYYGVPVPGSQPQRSIRIFHIPRTCRQIYLETVTMPYSTSTFVIEKMKSYHPGSGRLICCTPAWSCMHWFTVRMPAGLIQSIQKVRPCSEYVDSLPSWHGRQNESGLTSVFPSLKTVVLEPCEMANVRCYYYNLNGEKDGPECLQGLLSLVEGKALEIEYRRISRAWPDW